LQIDESKNFNPVEAQYRTVCCAPICASLALPGICCTRDNYSGA